MTDRAVGRISGAFGLAAVVVFAVELVLRTVPGPPPQLDDPLYRSYLSDNRVLALSWVALDMAMYVTLMVLWGGLRQRIVRARPEAEWLATLALVAGGVWWAVSLVADGLHGAAVLDTTNGAGDATVVRTLAEGTLLIWNSSVAFATTGLFMAAIGAALLVSRALPQWIGWFAILSAALCVVAIPAMFVNVVDHAEPYNAAGWVPMIVANVPPLIWFLIASVALLRRPDRGPSPVTELSRKPA